MPPPPVFHALFLSFQVSLPGSPGFGTTYQRHTSSPVRASSAAIHPRVFPSPALFTTITLPSAVIGAVKNRSRLPNSLVTATFLSHTISPVPRFTAMTRPSGMFAMTRSSHSAMPREREMLPSCETPGSVTQTSSPLSGTPRVDFVKGSPAVARVHEPVVDQRIQLALGAVLPDVLHAAERQRPDHAQIFHVLAVDLRELRISGGGVVPVHHEPVLRLVLRVDQTVAVDRHRVLPDECRRRHRSDRHAADHSGTEPSSPFARLDACRLLGVGGSPRY